MKIVLTSLAFAALAVACGPSMQPPTDRLASTDAAIRSARELGAQSDPQAALHLKLADEQIAQVYKNDVAPNIKQGASLVFAHGFNVHYGFVQPRADLTPPARPLDVEVALAGGWDARPGG